jgi:hypothetical protein
MPPSVIATEQTKATEKTQSAADQLLDYLATHRDAKIRYHASDMNFKITVTHLTCQFLMITADWVDFVTVEKNLQMHTDSMALSSSQLPSSIMWLRQQQNQK